MRFRRLAAAIAVAVLSLAACGTDAGSGTGSAAALRIMAPAAPGGGWDQTARTAEQAIKSADPKRQVEVFNVPGAGAPSAWPASPRSRATATCSWSPAW